MISKFYLCIRQLVHGKTDCDFIATTDIRPLSLLIFAVVADIFLRKLSRESLESTERTFADDTAMVVDDIAMIPPSY